jgi:hypothetical protein
VRLLPIGQDNRGCKALRPTWPRFEPTANERAFHAQGRPYDSDFSSEATLEGTDAVTRRASWKKRLEWDLAQT